MDFAWDSRSTVACEPDDAMAGQGCCNRRSAGRGCTKAGSRYAQCFFSSSKCKVPFIDRASLCLVFLWDAGARGIGGKVKTAFLERNVADRFCLPGPSGSGVFGNRSDVGCRIDGRFGSLSSAGERRLRWNQVPSTQTMRMMAAPSRASRARRYSGVS